MKAWLPLFFSLILFLYITGPLQFLLPPLSPVPSLTSYLPDLLFLLEEKQNKTKTEIAGLPGMSTEHSLASYNKTRHKSSYQGWLSTQLCWRTWVPSTGKRDTPSSTVENSQSTKLHNHEVYADPYRIYSCCFSLCEPLRALLSWSCGPNSRGVLYPPSSYNPFSSSFAGFPGSTLCLAVGLCNRSHQ